MPFNWLQRRASGWSPSGGLMTSEGVEKRADDIRRRLEEALDLLARADAGDEAMLKRFSQDLKRQLQALLEVLQDVEKSNAAGELQASAVKAWLSKFFVADLPKRLAENLIRMELEARNDVVTVLSHVVRIAPLAEIDLMYETAPAFFEVLVNGYDTPEIATHCGLMLRSCAREEKLVRGFLHQNELVLKLMTFTRHEEFEISSDAFASLHDFLLKHHDISAEYLEGNFRPFFTAYNKLLEEGDYVTKRQALKLLSDLLLARKFMRIMLQYIGDDSYLQLHMNLLRDESKTIQVEAFHVFKIFVANPQRPIRVHTILYKNKERLVILLKELSPHRAEDKQFMEDMKTVLSKLEALDAPVRTATAGYQSGADPSSPKTPKSAQDDSQAKSR